MKDHRIYINIKTKDGIFYLALTSTKPLVFHGDRGKSFKSSQNNYSYYYSMTRLTGGGHYKTNTSMYKFDTASAWMDREFFNHLLSSDQVGWDWFSLQLDSGEDIMVFQVRSTDGRYYKSGTLVHKDGTSVSLTAEDIELHPMAHWVSKKSKKRYPIKWALTIPSINKTLQVTARFKSQRAV